MDNGLVTELHELIALRRYAQKVPAKLKGRAMQTGDYFSRIRGRGMDFAEVRNYQAGDEIRHMEWRITARTGRPHIKLYQEERERPVAILVDFNPSMYFGTRGAFKSVTAARLAALIAWVAIKQGDRVGGLLYSPTEQNEFMPRGREMAVLPLLAALSHYTKINPLKIESARPMSEALLRLRRVTTPGSVVVLVSDFYNLDADSEKHLNRLRAHNDVLAYHVCDPLELSPPKPQYYGISNSKEEMLLDVGNREVYEAYQNYCRQRLLCLQGQLQSARIPHVSITAETDMPKLVHQTFPRRIVCG